MEALRKLLVPYYREAEYWLLNAPEEERELERLRQDILLGTNAEAVRPLPEEGKHGDVTGNKAVNLLTLERIEKWIELVKEIEQTEYGELIRQRRRFGKAKKNNPVWLRLARKMHYSERWLRQRWREVVYYTAFLALERGITQKKEAVYLEKSGA